MTFILRWPAILVLLALVLVSLSAAIATALVLGGVQVDLSVALTEDQIAQIRGVSWIEAGLWAGAGLFFLVSAIRLVRRTQGFWVWLLGFACYGGRWALAQSGADGGALATVQSVDINAYTQPTVLASAPDSTETQLGILAVVLLIGVIIFIVDAADRAYWNKQGA
jgi:hypothetical protein